MKKIKQRHPTGRTPSTVNDYTSPYGAQVLTAAFLIALLTITIYLPALNNGFLVNWDDDIYILDNIHIRALNLDLFRWAFLDYKTNLWHPISWISHAIDYSIWNLNPFGHHLTNILLHAVNTGIVVLLVYHITLTAGLINRDADSSGYHYSYTALITSVVTGLLFGIHPLHVESVAWVTERKDLLYSLFYMLSIIWYIRYATASPSAYPSSSFLMKRSYQVSLVLFFLSLASKPMAVTLPVVLILLDWYPLGRLNCRKDIFLRLREKLPFFLLSATVSAVTIIAQHYTGGLRGFQDAALGFRIILAMKSIVLYLCDVIAPVNLLPLYIYPADHSILKPEYLIYLFVIITISSICAYLRRHRFLATSWIIYITMLLPVLGLFQAGGQAMADRFMYLASVAPFTLIGLTIAHYWSTLHVTRAIIQAITLTILALGWMLFLAYTTPKQIGIWKDSVVLWNYQIGKKQKNDATIYMLRAVAYERHGMIDKALKDYATVLAVNSNLYMAYYNRGVLFLNTLQYAKAIDDFTKVIELVPNYFLAFNNRSKAYRLIGKQELALRDSNKAVELNASYYPAYINRGMALMLLEQPDKAINDFNFALKLNPELPDVIYARGDAYKSVGNIERAMQDYRTACDKGAVTGCMKSAFPF